MPNPAIPVTPESYMSSILEGLAKLQTVIDAGDITPDEYTALQAADSEIWSVL